MTSDRRDLVVTLNDEQEVAGLLQVPQHSFACYVLAHGAGAGMIHPFLNAVAMGLAKRNIASLRFQFPYMQKGLKRPDPPPVAHAAVRAAVAEASRHLPNIPLIAGGRSFGGRMSSQAQAKVPLENVRGLAFLGFPLHPTGQPSQERARHLDNVDIPMLFLQGTRDSLAHLEQLEPLVRRLGSRATLKLFNDADHSFHVPARLGKTDEDVRNELIGALADWIGMLAKSSIRGWAN
jgi:predicted alpha/beta-hydrolase family hydrolase